MKRFVKTLEPLSGLPKGFTEVEYLESTSTAKGQFVIDTGIVGKDGIESEITIMFEHIVNNECVLGCWKDTATRCWLAYVFSSKWHTGYNTNTTSNIDMVQNQWNTVRTVRDEPQSSTVGKYHIKVNDVDSSTWTYNRNWNNNVNITIFGMNNNTDGDTYSAKCKVSQCRLWDNKVLVRDFIPCLDLNNTPCMYDLVEGKPYYNTGAGTFLYGKQIIPVSYIENTSSSYIDTGYKPNNTTKVEAKFKMKETTSNFKWLFAARNENAAGSGFGFGAGTNGVITSDYNDRQAVSEKLVSGTIYNVVKDKNICKYNNNALINATSTFTVNYTLPIYGLNNVGTMTSGTFAYAECYYFRIYDNDVLVKDFIPAIDEDNTAYMFDRISHTIHSNKGSGTFSYGEKVYKNCLRLIQEKADLNGLPSGLKEVEYLEADGNQYIDTGIIGGSKSRIYVCASTTNTASNMALIGARDASTYNYSFALWQRATTVNVRFDYSDSTNQSISVAGWDTTKPNTMEKDAEKNYLNGVQQTSNNTKTFTCNYPFYLFGLNTGGTNGTPFVGKMYACKIWDDGVLVRDFVPAITTDTNKPGMYDKVSGKLFTNKGTGDFAYGHKIIPVEYIQSTGTQYIDMGFKPNQDTRITADFEYTQDPNNKGFIFGAGISATSTAYEFYPWGTSWNSPYNNTNIQIASGLSSMAGQKFHLDKNKNVLDVIYEDGTVKNSSATYATFETTRTLWLFAINRGSMEATYFSNCVKLYNCQIYDNDKLIYDLIPVIDEDNTGYMFDKISHILFANSGSSDFTYGEKNYTKRIRFGADPWYMKDYDLVSYIESPGSAYIDTGYNIVTSTDEVEFDYELLSDTIYKWIFGEHDDGKRFGLGSGDGEAKRNVAYGSTTIKAADTYFFNSKHHYKASTAGVYLDDTKFANYTSFSSTSTLYLFNLNLSGNDYCTQSRIWKYTHKRNGQYIRYYLPAKRKSDNKYGMLDLVSRQFYPSIGSGDFTGE